MNILYNDAFVSFDSFKIISAPTTGREVQYLILNEDNFFETVIR